MKYLKLIMIVVLSSTCVWAVVPPSAQETFCAVQAALKQRIRTLRSQPEGVALRQRLELAQKNREEAERNLPGMGALDERIQEVRNRLRALNIQRNAIVRAHKAELEVMEDKILEAEKALSEHERGDPQLKALLAQRKALIRASDGNLDLE